MRSKASTFRASGEGGEVGEGGRETWRRVNELQIIPPILTTGSPVLEGQTVSGFEKWRVTAMAKLTENRY